MSWIGTLRDLKTGLKQIGAEVDSDGNYLLAGKNDGTGRSYQPVSFMGATGPDAELLVPGGCMFKRGDAWLSVSDHMPGELGCKAGAVIF